MCNRIDDNLSRANADLNLSWLTAIRRYLIFVAGANLVWEFAHLPLYTIWREGSANEIIFAAAHCAGGDLLIAGSCLIGSLTVLGGHGWPRQRFYPVAVLTIATGLLYTVFSEWLNIEIRGAWAYSDLMPITPLFGTGLSPVLQWIVVPAAGFYVAVRRGGPDSPLRRLAS